jgi:hypothetical protein
MAIRRAYVVTTANPVASPTVTAQVIGSSTTMQPYIFFLDLGSAATPADNALTFAVQRCTALGTSTSFTPPPTSPVNIPSNATVGITCTAEPTYTAGKVLLQIAINQRSTHPIYFNEDAPLQMPATANNGLGIYAVHASFTGNINVTTYFCDN